MGKPSKKSDPILDAILEALGVVKDKILAPDSTVEVKEILAYTGQLSALRAQNFKISPDEEISGLDKLRRKLEHGNSKSGGSISGGDTNPGNPATAPEIISADDDNAGESDDDSADS